MFEATLTNPSRTELKELDRRVCDRAPSARQQPILTSEGSRSEHVETTGVPSELERTGETREVCVDEVATLLRTEARVVC